MDEFTTFVSNVGFPIAAFCAMFYMCDKTIKENTKAVQECTEVIRSERIRTIVAERAKKEVSDA